MRASYNLKVSLLGWWIGGLPFSTSAHTFTPISIPTRRGVTFYSDSPSQGVAWCLPHGMLMVFEGCEIRPRAGHKKERVRANGLSPKSVWDRSPFQREGGIDCMELGLEVQHLFQSPEMTGDDGLFTDSPASQFFPSNLRFRPISRPRRSR